MRKESQRQAPSMHGVRAESSTRQSGSRAQGWGWASPNSAECPKSVFWSLQLSITHRCVHVSTHAAHPHVLCFSMSYMLIFTTASA